MLLSNKILIVTGGCNGIGCGCVKTYIEEGVRAALLDIQPSGNWMGKIGNNHLGLECDIIYEDQVATAIRTTIDHFGKIDAAYNDAGIASPAKPLPDADGKHEIRSDMEEVFHRLGRKSI